MTPYRYTNAGLAPCRWQQVKNSKFQFQNGARFRRAKTKFLYLHPWPDPFLSFPNRDRTVAICRCGVIVNPSSFGTGSSRPR
jgi:hypothetical protein